MLVQPNKNALGDKILSGEEMTTKLVEDCLREASVNKTGDQDELADIRRSEGKRLAYTEVLARIQRINPRIRVLDGSPGNVALYLPKTPAELFTDAPITKSPKGEFFDLYKYVGGMPKQELPEFGHVDLDSSHLATREHIRGWRTVLISLIKTGAVSYRAAVKQFGDCQTDARGGIWRRELQMYKK